MATERRAAGNILAQKKTRKAIRLTLSYIVLVLGALIALLPFYVVLITSFKPNGEALEIPFRFWPSNGHLDFSGYIEVLFGDKSGGVNTVSSIVRGLGNTLLVVVPSILVWLFVSAIAAYSFAKVRFPLKNVLFYTLLATMMVPGIIMLSPSYVIYDELGLVNTFFPLMVPSMFGGAVCIFFLRQFFKTIPNDILDAAKVDGLNQFQIFIRIAIPLSLPALLSQGILGFVSGYNDYLAPLLYLQTPDKYTLQIALSMFSGTYTSKYQTIMAGTVVSIIPTVVLFLLAQRYFIKGVTMSGVKG